MNNFVALDFKTANQHRSSVCSKFDNTSKKNNKQTNK